MTASRTRLFGAFSFISAAAIFLLQAVDYLNFGVDDVFISMRYAANWAAGYGPVFNRGEYVEGYSNFLWVGLLTLYAKLDPSSDPMRLLWAAKSLSLIFGLATIVLLFHFTRRAARSTNLAWFSVLTLVCSGCFVLWSMGGLETTMIGFILLALVAVGSIERPNRVLLTALLVAVSLTRPEGIAYATILTIVLLRLDRPINVKKLLASFAWVLPVACFLIWRWVTYHDLLPNTFYAKTGGGVKSLILGIKYCLAGLAFLGTPYLVTALPLLSDRISWTKATKVSLTIILMNILFVVYGGGDWMAGFRFTVPILPILIYLGLEGYQQLARKIDVAQFGGWVAMIVIAVILLGQVFAARILVRGQIQTMPTGYSVVTGHSTPWHEEIGYWLRDSTDGKISLATSEAGMIAYLNPELRLIDLFGLMDKTIAHSKKRGEVSDPNYVFDQRPDFFLVYNGSATAVIANHIRPIADFTLAVVSSPRFLGEYQLRKEFISMSLYERKDRPKPQ